MLAKVGPCRGTTELRKRMLRRNYRDQIDGQQRQRDEILGYARQQDAERQCRITPTQTALGTAQPLRREADRQMGKGVPECAQALDQRGRRHQRVDGDGKLSVN